MDYQATYRRSEVAIPALLAVVAIFIAATVAMVKYVDGRHFETAFFSLAGFVVVSLGVILMTTFRVHRWMVLPHGVEIFQRPKVRFAGLSRKTVVPFQEIAALRNVESGFDRLIEIVTRDGRRFRLSQAYVGGAAGIGRPDPGADLWAFAASIRDAAERAGTPLPALSEGLSFWNSAVGLTLIAIMFAISLAISAAVAFALWDGMTVNPRPRGGEAIAILLLLPVGAGWLLIKSLKRRAMVRASIAVHHRDNAG